MNDRYSQPLRLYSVDLKLCFPDETAREYFRSLLTDTTSEITLGSLMLTINDEAVIKFPPHAELPVFGKSHEGMDMADVEYFSGPSAVKLSVDTDDDVWVFDKVLGEPVRLSSTEPDPGE